MFNGYVSKLLSLIAVLLALCISSCNQERSGRWLVNGKPVSDSANAKVKKGFGGHLIIVEDPTAFAETWDKPDFPNTDTVKKVHRHQIGGFILFAGCTPDPHDKCDVVANYTLINPEGVVRGEEESLVWNKEAPPKENTQRSLGALLIEMGVNDVPGLYTVRAVVKDRNAGTAVELEESFELN